MWFWKYTLHARWDDFYAHVLRCLNCVATKSKSSRISLTHMRQTRARGVIQNWLLILKFFPCTLLWSFPTLEASLSWTLTGYICCGAREKNNKKKQKKNENYTGFLNGVVVRCWAFFSYFNSYEMLLVLFCAYWWFWCGWVINDEFLRQQKRILHTSQNLK